MNHRQKILNSEHLNKQEKSINDHIFKKYYDDHKLSQIHRTAT